MKGIVLAGGSGMEINFLIESVKKEVFNKFKIRGQYNLIMLNYIDNL